MPSPYGLAGLKDHEFRAGEPQHRDVPYEQKPVVVALQRPSAREPRLRSNTDQPNPALQSGAW